MRSCAACVGVLRAACATETAAELRLTSRGDCFYAGDYADADPAAAGSTYQSQHEQEHEDCRAAVWN